MSRDRRQLEEGDVYIDLELGPRRRGTPARERAAAAPVHLIAESVSYRRAGRTILDCVDVSVSAGETLAVVGPSGSGKSSLLALIAGLEEPDSGRVRREPRGGGRVGIVLQGYGLVSVLTAAENVEVPLQAGVAGAFEPRQVRETAAAALASVGLTEVSDHLVEELSGGQQQRVAVARALAIEPDVVFADEPTAELDHDMKQGVIELLLGIAHRGGIAVVATHDGEIAARCSRQLRLQDGRVVH